MTALDGAVAAVEATCHPAALRSPVHGPRHWRDVARIGRLLRLKGIRCDPLVVFLFALIHDSQRTNDGHDPDHGRRAATFAEGLDLDLAPDQRETLTTALELHADGQVSDDATMGACWDADRLNLWRVGVEPEPQWLSTWAARDSVELVRGFHLGADATWPEIAKAVDG